MAEIRVLAVRQPWASLIVEGLKTIEIRSRPTNIRGRIAIYVSGNNKFLNDNLWYRVQLASIFNDDVRYNPQKYLPDSEYLNFGNIIGTVEISDCYPISRDEYRMRGKKHLSPMSFYIGKSVYAWELVNPTKFENPIPYKPPKGAIVWSKTVLPEGY
jgi:hypothetical protein